MKCFNILLYFSLKKKIYIYIWYSSLKDSFEVAIESWPEWDLNPRPLNSVQTL